MTKLALMMQKRNVKDKDIAKQLGVVVSHVNMLRNGQRKMTADVLMRLAEILQCEAHEIYGDVEEPETVEAA